MGTASGMTLGVVILIVVAAWCSISIVASLLFGAAASPRDRAPRFTRPVQADDSEIRRAS
jgi:hypothetical protein